MKYYLLAILFISCIKCTPKKTITQAIPDAKVETDFTKEESTIFEQKTAFMVVVDRSNMFRLKTVDKAPTPVQGVDSWLRDFYMALRYPADSREKGIQGTVKIEITINVDGSIESVSYLQKVAPDIDQAAIDAFNIATKKGFYPAILDGVPVKAKATVPLHFRLG